MMKYRVTYEINRYQIADERNRTAGWLKRPVLTGNWLEVYGADGSRKYRIVRQDGEIWVEEPGGERRHSAMEFLEDENGKRIQASFLRPPMAERTAVRVKEGELAVCQTEKRQFSIWVNGEKIGELTHMLSPVKSICLPEDLPKEYCGLCFAIGFLMLHEDDLAVV